jgi:hypothetical protein
MSIRSKEIYVAPRTKKRLYWIRQLVNPEPGAVIPVKAGEIMPHLATTDEIADSLLNEIIEQKYPNIKILEKRLDALEGQLITELLSPTVEK